MRGQIGGEIDQTDGDQPAADREDQIGIARVEKYQPANQKAGHHRQHMTKRGMPRRPVHDAFFRRAIRESSHEAQPSTPPNSANAHTTKTRKPISDVVTTAYLPEFDPACHHAARRTLIRINPGLTTIKAGGAQFCQNINGEVAMYFRWIGVFCAIVALVAFSGAAELSPLRASMHPQENKRPTPQLEVRPVSPSATELFDLLNCVDALARGQFAKGEAACSAAIALNAGNSNAYKLRGYGYLLEHRFERAATDFRVALRLKPRDAESLAGYGESLSGQGKFAPAVAQFTKAIALAPGASAYWNARCWARAGDGRRLDLALADCNHALTLSPAAPGVLNSRGLVRLRMGQFPAAIADYTNALAAKPAQASARFGRGLARLHLGQKDAAAADIASARKMDSDIDSLFVLMDVLPRDCATHSGRAACPPPPPNAPEKNTSQPWLMVSFEIDSDDDVLFAIEADRLNIMLDQMARILRQPQDEHHSDIARLDDSRQSLLVQLSRAAARFNRLLPAACRNGRLLPQLCAGSYRATWTGAPLSAGPAQAIGKLYQHVHPVWTALCAGHRKLCRLE